MGFDNLLPGSDTPTIFDDKTQKCVVDSPGIRETLGFYHAVYSEHLGAALSDLVLDIRRDRAAVPDPEAEGRHHLRFQLLRRQLVQHHRDAALAAGGADCGCRADPTMKGQPPGIATTIGGWDLVASATTKHPDPTWQLLELMENEENQIDAANWAGFVPGDADYVKSSTFVNFAVPYNAMSAQVLPYGVIEPPNANYLIWSRGVQEATGALARHPDTTVDAAVKISRRSCSTSLATALCWVTWSS
jgi:hypothetical protein